MRRVIVLLALVMMLTPAFAGVVYDNGGPNQQNGNDMTEWVQTEDFTLASPATITGITFWDIQSGAYNGSLTYIVYDDAAGLPGSVLEQANTSSVARTYIQLVMGGLYSEYINTISGLNIALAAGTYHLGLHNGPLSQTSRMDFYWETTNSNATPTGIERDLLYGGPWSGNGLEHAFYLTDDGASVPEPASLLLVGVGLLGLGWIRRRR
jgi:hypothetical protein